MRLLWSSVGIAAVVACGAAIWGFSGRTATTLEVMSGQWATVVSLKERYETCGYQTTTDFEGRTSQVWRCTTHTRTLGSRDRFGYCDVLKCGPVTYPEFPAEWQQRAESDYDIYLDRDFSGWIYYRDLELGDGTPFGLPYSRADYEAQLGTIGDRVKSYRNNFGLYDKPGGV